MRSAISKEQSQELRQVLTRYKASKETIDLLLSSKNASNTYKAYKLKKRIVTDNDWVINFGANWAKAPDETTEMGIARSRRGDEPRSSNTATVDSSVSQTPEQVIDALEHEEKSKPSEDLASKTLQSIVSLIKKPKPKPPPEPSKPRMLKVALEVDEEVLVKLKKLADAEGIPLSSMIRLAIRKYVD